MNETDRTEIEAFINRAIRESENRLLSQIRNIVREEILRSNRENTIRLPEMAISREINSGTEAMGESTSWMPPSAARLTWDDLGREYEISHLPQNQNLSLSPIEVDSLGSPVFRGEDVSQAIQEEITKTLMIPKEILTGEKKEDTKKDITRTDLMDLEE